RDRNRGDAGALRLRGVVAVLAWAACSESRGPASLRIRVDRDPSSATPSYVMLSAYAGRPGSGFHGQRIEGSLPADDVIAPLDDFTPWRMIAWGFVSGRSAPVSFATVEVRPAASGETLALVRLTGNLPADSDGDGVPDAYDDCPMTPDPA